ncbi:hypothetical protein I552_9670 [Mycobacterium xenopi 3993]|nr:hypothetical protein I552_9670 [Mycobacterium xenopi 3993]
MHKSPDVKVGRRLAWVIKLPRVFRGRGQQQPRPDADRLSRSL